MSVVLPGLPIRAEDLRLVAILGNGEPALAIGEPAAAVHKALDGMARRYRAEGFAPPWIGYLAQAGGEIVGSCAFASPPQADTVAIAYRTFAGHEGRGVATAMVHRLIELALRSDPTLVLSAQTPAHESAATRVLRKLGFRLRDSLHDPRHGIVWHWEWEAA